MSVYIGVDLGGTKIAAAAVDPVTGAVAGHTVIPTQAHEGQDAVIARIAGVVEQVRRQTGLAPEQVGGIGVGVPGLVDLTLGHTLFLPNLPTAWRDVPLAPRLSAMTGYPTVLINDARAFVLAEANLGAGRGADTVVGLTLGTGIGGGIAFQGRLHLGLEGTGGEAGHQTIDPNGPPCGCGNRGCLEALASGPAIAAMGIKAIAQGLTTRIGAIVDHDLNRVTPETIMRAAEDGDDVARDILRRAGTYLGIGVANLVTLLSPDRVIVGGGVARLGEWLMEPVRATVRDRCHVTPLNRVAIVPADLGEAAGIVGSAVWAEQNVMKTSPHPQPLRPSGANGL